MIVHPDARVGGVYVRIIGIEIVTIAFRDGLPLIFHTTHGWYGASSISRRGKPPKGRVCLNGSTS